MTRTVPRTLFLLLMLSAAGPALAAGLPAPPAGFEKLVPSSFGNGLELVEIRERCKDCAPWRMVDIQADGAPARQEKVSVADGVTAMYAFPGTGYFANAKIERSAPGRYAQDQALVLEAVADRCAGMKAHVETYVNAHPDTRAKLDRMVAKGKDYVEFERASYRGYDYAACTQNALGLTGGGVISELEIFVPQGDTIVTAYLLQQKQTRFQTIDEFLKLRREFIEGYIDFLGGQ